VNRETGGPEQRLSNAEQGINAAHRQVSWHINQGAVCNAIAAIFVAFKPAAPSQRQPPETGRLADALNISGIGVVRIGSTAAIDYRPTA
jgi:hypothetical protein